MKIALVPSPRGMACNELLFMPEGRDDQQMLEVMRHLWSFQEHEVEHLEDDGSRGQTLFYSMPLKPWNKDSLMCFFPAGDLHLIRCRFAMELREIAEQAQTQEPQSG